VLFFSIHIFRSGTDCRFSLSFFGNLDTDLDFEQGEASLSEWFEPADVFAPSFPTWKIMDMLYCLIWRFLSTLDLAFLFWLLLSDYPSSYRARTSGKGLWRVLIWGYEPDSFLFFFFVFFFVLFSLFVVGLCTRFWLRFQEASTSVLEGSRSTDESDDVVKPSSIQVRDVVHC
jgi:hypothetical protein